MGDARVGQAWESRIGTLFNTSPEPLPTVSGRLFAEPVPTAILAIPPFGGFMGSLDCEFRKTRPGRSDNGNEGGHRPVAVHPQPAGRSGRRSRDVAAPDGGRLQRQLR